MPESYKQFPANPEPNLALRDEFRPAITILRSRWKWVAAGVFFALLVGVAARGQYSDRREFAGVILHTPLPNGESNKHIIPMADLKSLSSLVKSPDSLQAVVDRERLYLTAQALAERIEVKAIPGSQTLGMNLQWGGAGNGEAILDSVMKEFIARAGELRKQRMEERAADFNASRANFERELQSSRLELAAFYRANGTLDPPRELRTATAELDVLSSALSLSRRNEASCKAQLAELAKTIEDLAHQAPTVGSGTQSPLRLQQLINEERLRELSQAKLEVKRRELELVQKAAAKGAAGQLELSRVAAEVAELQAQAQDNEKILEWKKDLVELEKNTNAPPSIQQTFTKKLDLDLLLLGYRNEIPLLEAESEAKQLRIERFLKVQAESAPLIWQVERAEAERNRMQAHLDQIKSLLTISGGEATVYQPATAITKPFGDARSWLIPIAMGGCAFLFWVWAVVTISPRHAERSFDSLASEMGLPVLAKLPTGVQVLSADRNVRSLALSLRQRLPRVGATVLFTPVKGGLHTHELLQLTAGCLAQRDERVLIIDAVCGEGDDRVCFGDNAKAVAIRDGDQLVSPPLTKSVDVGLSNYLAFEFAWPNEVVRSTEVYGVDFLPAGTAVISPDALATQRMRELLELLRQTYSIILIAGPPFSSVTDLQILAAHQDGAVVLLDETTPISGTTRELIRNHRYVGVPFLGCVQLAG